MGAATARADPQMPFSGLRVIEQASGIAAAYCGKMLADAGAEVVKVEPTDGDPMRHWRFRGDPEAAQGVLFSYLAAGKRSVSAASATDLFEAADVVITDLSDGSTLSEVAERTARPSAVIVAVTPFGCRGPLGDTKAPVNEFVLQAMCGSTGSRGWPGEEPLQAGGRIGEWVAGSFAAVAAAACARHARRTGRGEVVDVSIYESMVISMGSLGAMAHSVLGDDAPVGGRSIELPSIVPTADGLVGFCTITAQQFQDFLILIDRPELLDDAELASFAGRVRRREEFLSAVHEWAAAQKTQDIIELASALRIPVAAITTPDSVSTVDHFVERGVFAVAPDGAVHPRVPYRSPAIATRAPMPAPELGADSDRICWESRHSANRTAPSSDRPPLPLSDVRILDLTAFWAGPVATSVLAALGADVIKVEGVRRPDGMRFANGRPPSWGQWWEWGPVYLCSNTNKQALSLELTHPGGRKLALDLIRHSDLIIENFSPRVLAHFGLEWDVVHAVNSATSMVRMPAFGLDGPWRDRVGFAQTMEQASGMAWMTGPRDGPPIVPRGPCDPIAGLHAAFAAIAALEVRDRTGAGIHVESTMVEAAINVAAEALIEASRGGATPSRDGNRGSGSCPQGVFPCAEDDSWVAIAVLRDADWPAFAIAIGQPGLAADPSLSDEFSRRARADELDTAITAWTVQRAAAHVVDELRAIGVGVARVIEPCELLSDNQLDAVGFWEVVDHPVAGRFKTTGMPFTFAGRARKWIRTPAPTYGQHNEDVLVGVLGTSTTELQHLTAIGVVSDRPAGL